MNEKQYTAKNEYGSNKGWKQCRNKHVELTRILRTNYGSDVMEFEQFYLLSNYR